MHLLERLVSSEVEEGSESVDWLSHNGTYIDHTGIVESLVSIFLFLRVGHVSGSGGDRCRPERIRVCENSDVSVSCCTIRPVASP